MSITATPSHQRPTKHGLGDDSGRAAALQHKRWVRLDPVREARAPPRRTTRATVVRPSEVRQARLEAADSLRPGPAVPSPTWERNPRLRPRLRFTQEGPVLNRASTCPPDFPDPAPDATRYGRGDTAFEESIDGYVDHPGAFADAVKVTRATIRSTVISFGSTSFRRLHETAILKPSFQRRLVCPRPSSALNP